MMRTRWERYSSPCYILPQNQSEETKKPEVILRLFRVSGKTKTQYPVLCQKEGLFFCVFLRKMDVVRDRILWYNDCN